MNITIESFKTKKQKERFSSICPNGVPKWIRLYDDEECFERYTCAFTKIKPNGEFWNLGMSENPYHPQGIGQHGYSRNQIDRPAYAHLGKKIKWVDLPQECKQCVIHTYLSIWGFVDDTNNPIG